MGKSLRGTISLENPFPETENGQVAKAMGQMALGLWVPHPTDTLPSVGRSGSPASVLSSICGPRGVSLSFQRDFY